MTPPAQPWCGTTRVHRRLLDTLPGYAGACAEIENFTFRHRVPAREVVLRFRWVVEEPDRLRLYRATGEAVFQILAVDRDRLLLRPQDT